MSESLTYDNRLEILNDLCVKWAMSTIVDLTPDECVDVYLETAAKIMEEKGEL